MWAKDKRLFSLPSIVSCVLYLSRGARRCQPEWSGRHPLRVTSPPAIDVRLWTPIILALMETKRALRRQARRKHKENSKIVAMDCEDAVAKGRPRMEHSQIMQMADLERSGKLGGA